MHLHLPIKKNGWPWATFRQRTALNNLCGKHSVSLHDWEWISCRCSSFRLWVALLMQRHIKWLWKGNPPLLSKRFYYFIYLVIFCYIGRAVHHWFKTQNINIIQSLKTNIQIICFASGWGKSLYCILNV